ncbi:sigma-54 dependent transcriptional regulator [Methylocapsa acidiphila]|uniref:sigma-54 dependent transcriptional regulator n=1 Tax=Methylocapsa acidiphila TaxID=133552 RepID=UPI0003F807AD|nr:sigma-54 dependent transcriptional regulator [Methylocapsa acidiphila]
MGVQSTILFVADPCPRVRAAAASLAREPDYRVIVAERGGDAAEAINDAHVDLILADVDMADCDVIAFLSRLRFTHPNLVRILLVEGESCAGLNEALTRTAAYQYLTKPLQAEQACLVVKRALETGELARRHRRLVRELKIGDDSIFLQSKPPAGARDEASHFERLVYASESMAELCSLAREVARTDLPVLIEGETGTGKELLARAMHFHSRRTSSPLMAQNCGGMRDELLHSELFGHKRGAFTGAISDRLGLFRAADGGTVFLDEISEVSPSFQVSLLRFLQEGEVKPLGSDKTMKADVRIIAASNKPLKQLVRAGQFREDLYFRLKGFDLELPPLRARPTDIPVLTEYFVRKHGGLLSNRVLGVSNDVIEIFKSYRFPGNVRELENEVRRMVALAKDGEYLTRRHLSPALAALRAGAHDRLVLKADGKTLKEMVESLEGQLVRQVLEKCRWNQSKAARELGLSRVGLANKIRRYALAEGAARAG